MSTQRRNLGNEELGRDEDVTSETRESGPLVLFELP
jgi:hypothetical protein